MAARFGFWNVRTAVAVMGAEDFNKQMALAIVDGLDEDEERSRWLMATITSNAHNSSIDNAACHGIDVSSRQFKSARDFIKTKKITSSSDEEIAAELNKMRR